MKTISKYPLIITTMLALFCAGYSQIRPNIIFILTDDQGIGDVSAYNPDAKFTTPHLDSLAASGIMFTDIHSPWSSCMPSRYGLLTGRFPFRGPDMNSWREQPLINEGRMTLGSVLQQDGYHTGAVGKWHLGFDYSNYNNLTGGPLDRGFDYYFGISRSLDQADYYYIENRAATQPPTVNVPASPGTGPRGTQGAFWRVGERGADFVFEEVMYKFQDHAITYIEEQAADTTSPFFLYLPLASPHSPWLPSQEYLGTTELGKMNGDEAIYGDWMVEIDDVIGRILGKVYELGLRENTLIFFSSDNGPNWWPENVAATGHDASHIYTGSKFSVYEGGHRVPFIVSWPGVIPSNSTSNQLFNFTDMLATFAAIAGTALPNNAGEDSYNIWPALLNPNLAEPVRGGAALIGEEDYIRQDDWKLVSNDELYNIAGDPSEGDNVYNQNRSIANDLDALRDKYHNDGRSTPTSRPAEPIIFGCMDSEALNFVPEATVEPENACSTAAGTRPSPAGSSHEIKFTSNGFIITGHGSYRLRINDPAGKSVYTGIAKGDEEHPVSLPCAPGLYFLRVSSPSGSTAVYCFSLL